MELSEDWGQLVWIASGCLGLVYAVLDGDLLLALAAIALVVASFRIQQLSEQVRELRS